MACANLPRLGKAYWQCVLLVCLCFSGHSVRGQEVMVSGLFSGAAVLVIDGQQQLLKAGRTSPEGVTLISADSRGCVVEIAGQRHNLSLSQQIASGFAEAASLELRLPEADGGHYYAEGQINGHAVQFLVDTGATNVSMNRSTAERLGINFRAGEQAYARTAAGVTPIFLVTLARVTVGGISVDQVQASVHVDESPPIVLLGNSFLGQLEMKKDNGVLVLSAHR